MDVQSSGSKAGAGSRATAAGGAPVERVHVAAYTVPTETPESDGTLAWTSTTIVVVELEAGGVRGLGYTYAPVAAATLIEDRLAERVQGRDVFAIPAIWAELQQSVRNAGQPGIAAMAISALDTALWDAKARMLGLPLALLLGPARDRVPVYGSGGFTSYSTEQLVAQLGGWVSQGITRVKMKVGRDPNADPGRVRAARAEIGPAARLFVDANGAYRRKQALALAETFAESDVSWFEEPVSSNDLEGLRLLRDRAPAGMEIAAGEYGYGPVDFLRFLRAGAVDVLQADATRCGGPSGFLRAAALCDAEGLAISAHTAPMVHLPICCAASRLIHLEYFFDHVRLEPMFFDGVRTPVEGELVPDLTRPGLGLELKRKDAERFATRGGD
jgi:L-alanine-DL-glutamate epimerase-like enolase superfamily enzyme